MANVYTDCDLKKVYVSGTISDSFPSPRGVCWNLPDKLLFFGGCNFDSDFPLVYNINSRQGSRLKFATSGRTKTRLVRPSLGSACIEHESSVYVFGGQNLKTFGQPATDDFVVGQFKGSAFCWDTVNQRGYTPSPRFGHTFTKCGNLGVVYGGLDCVNSRLVHVNNNLYFFNLCDMTWSTRPVPLMELAHHTCTYVGQNTLVIIGGCTLRGHCMIRNGGVHIVQYAGTARPENFRVKSFESDLHISSHAAEQVGDFVYIFGGYCADSEKGTASPSANVHRVHIPSLLNGKLVIETHALPNPFSPCYTMKQGLQTFFVFRLDNQSVWQFTASTSADLIVEEPEDDI